MKALVNSMSGDHPGRPALILSNSETSGGLTWARQQGLETAVVDHRPFGQDRVAYGDALAATLAPINGDILCLAGFMRVLSAEFVTPWMGRMLNIHPSLLPKYRGLHTHQRALDAGDQDHGCTVHEVTPALDDGPILGQARVPILAKDTAETLAARVLVQEHILYPEVLRRFASGDRTQVTLG